jgi:hypothetical protein
MEGSWKIGKGEVGVGDNSMREHCMVITEK